MTAGMVVATAHGPVTAEAANHTPLWSPYHSLDDTMMIGVGELNTYISEVSCTGFRSGAPLMTGVNVALVRDTDAVSGIWFAMTASCACAVPGIDAFTFSFGLSSGIFEKSGGRSLAATYCHGPVNAGARNQRPVTST